MQADRFIPSRSGINFDAAHFALTSDLAAATLGGGGAAGEGDGSGDAAGSAAAGAAFKRTLAANLLSTGGGDDECGSVASADGSVGEGDATGGGAGDTSYRVLAFKQKAPAPPDGYASGMKVLYTQNRAAAPKVKTTRHIPSAPERVLDAPELVDDYYLNLLDWSPNNVLAVALGPAVYLWNAASGSIEELMHTSAADDYVTSVSWMTEGGGYLAVGTASADVQLWDTERMRQVRSMKGHTARVGALDWNAHLLSSGSRDTMIFNHDVRVREHHVATLAGHTQEVCGLAWSPDGTALASGANDNMLCIWDNTTSAGARTLAPKHTLASHQAAVKALAWCPWQKGVLASGGGTADRCIKTWNAATGALLTSTDTGSQVCALAWNPHERELLSSHGFSMNQLTLWKYPTMTKIKELTGHTARVLHLAASPDGSTVCSAGADETLRFWRVFGEPRVKDAAGGVGGGAAGGVGSGPAGGAGAPAAAAAPGIMRGLAIR